MSRTPVQVAGHALTCLMVVGGLILLGVLLLTPVY